MRLAVIGTFYRRWERNAEILMALHDQYRQADEHWLMVEDHFDAKALVDAMAAVEWVPPGLRLITLPTPVEDGRYAVIPYSHKINWALDRTEADAIVYLDNGSLPHREKFASMSHRLETANAVYCGQRRTGMIEADYPAEDVVADAYCVLNYTQVMHRRTDDRWTLDMAHADPDLADALFWRSLHESLGPFHPVEGILDTHHIPDRKAVGV